MSDSSNKDGSQKLAAGLLLIVGLLIVGAGAWFVLGPGAGSPGSNANTAQPSLVMTAAGEIEAALAAARSYTGSDESAKAEAVLRSAVDEHVEDQSLRLAYAEVLMDLQKEDLAYEQYEAALAIGPRDKQIEFNAGTLAFTNGLHERALEHFSMARSADPGSAEYALYLGVVQHQLSMIDEAKASLLAAYNLDESRAEASTMLAQISLDENDTSLALRYIRKSRVNEPGQIAHRILEARILRRMNEPEEALTLLMALPEDDLFQPMVLEMCGACMGLLGKQVAAAELYEKAVERDPTNPELAFQAAQWHERAGNDEAALTQAKRASMLGHEQARTMVTRLEGG